MTIHLVFGESFLILDCSHYWEINLRFHTGPQTILINQAEKYQIVLCYPLEPSVLGWTTENERLKLYVVYIGFRSWKPFLLELCSSCASHDPAPVASPRVYVSWIKSRCWEEILALYFCPRTIPGVFAMALWHAECLCQVSYSQWFPSPSAASLGSFSHLVLTTSVLLVSRCNILHLVVLEKHFVWTLQAISHIVDGQSNCIVPEDDGSAHSFALFLSTEGYTRLLWALWNLQVV